MYIDNRTMEALWCINNHISCILCIYDYNILHLYKIISNHIYISYLYFHIFQYIYTFVLDNVSYLLEIS